MRIQVTVCDICDRRIEGRPTVVRVEAHPECAELLRRPGVDRIILEERDREIARLRAELRLETGKVVDLGAELTRLRRMAADGLTGDRSLQRVLQDVASGARR